MKTTLTALISMCLCWFAGIYLLTSESASQEATVFDTLMHGIGLYFLARGFQVLYLLWRTDDKIA